MNKEHDPSESHSSLSPVKQLAGNLLRRLRIVRAALHHVLKGREIRPEGLLGIAASNRNQWWRPRALYRVVYRIRKVTLIAKTFILGMLGFADDDDDGVGLAEEGIVCFRETDLRHVWHVADALVIAAQCAAERLKGVDVLVARFIGRLTRRCNGGSEQQ